MIDFLFTKYTDVSWWQIAGGWYCTTVLLHILIFRKPKDTVVETIEVPRELTDRETQDIVSPYVFERDRAVKELQKVKHDAQVERAIHSLEQLKFRRANDKLVSLEAKIARLTVRPRGKDGKFQKKQG